MAELIFRPDQPVQALSGSYGEATFRCDRLVEREMATFPEVLPYSHRWHTVFYTSITSEYNSDNGSPSRHISTIFGRSPYDFPFSRIFTRTDPGLPNANQAMRHLSGERNHKRACQILQMYINGLSNVEIAKNLNIDESSVRRHLQRIINRLKGPSELAI